MGSEWILRKLRQYIVGPDPHYTRFVKGFSSITSPLTKLTQNKVKFFGQMSVKRNL